MQPIVIPQTPDQDELPERDPNCELCQHQWFSAHLHSDGSGRVISRDARTVYILDRSDDVPTCTCPNGQHTEPGREPKCWHIATYKQLLQERRLLAAALLEQGRQRATLEEVFEINWPRED